MRGADKEKQLIGLNIKVVVVDEFAAMRRISRGL